MIYKTTTVGGVLGFPEYKIHQLNLGLFYFQWNAENSGWCRLFGNWYGIHWKHVNNDLLFSERNGYTKSCVIGKYRFKILEPGYSLKKRKKNINLF